MRWRDLRQSGNVEDRRGMSGRGLAVGGIGTVVIMIVAFFLGIDPRKLLNSGGDTSPAPGTQATRPMSAEEKEMRDFTGAVLGSTEDVWSEIFRQQGGQYAEPKLTLFDEQVRSACGLSSAAVGPFYCPGDQKVYLDLSFFRELQTRFRAPGDFAQAYVIAHEIGHHIQNLTGTMNRVNQLQARGGEREANQLSVRLELQADCYAGVWGHYAQRRGILEQGDVEEALRAATAIGDDQLQKQSQGYVVPDSFTHGSSEQRMRWFHKGLETGDIRQCDTFNARSP